MAGVFSGRAYVPLVLLGLHSSTAVKVLVEVFEQALAAKDWTRALKVLDLYSQDVEELFDVKDAVLSCAAAEGKKDEIECSSVFLCLPPSFSFIKNTF